MFSQERESPNYSMKTNCRPARALDPKWKSTASLTIRLACRTAAVAQLGVIHKQLKRAAMEEIDGIVQNIDLKIDKDSVLFFDMDGTLVDTNFANYISYRDAIQSTVTLYNEIRYKPNERFNRTCLKTLAPNLTEIEYKKIIQQKEVNFVKHIPQTMLKNSVVNILIQYYKTNRTVLVTNCREDRALMILNYHDLIDKFDSLFFRQSTESRNLINKYQNAISCLDLPAKKVIVFENEMQEINDAFLAGIPIDNIIKFQL